MSLDDLLWRHLHFQNVIIKCLRIESVEYCYFIPIISQLADYWGDRKIACLCKIMSRKVKQHLNYAIHIHLLANAPPPFRDLKGKGSRKGEQLKDFLRDSHYADATFRTPYGTSGFGDAVGSLTKEESPLRAVRQRQRHLFFDSSFKNLFKSIKVDPFMEAYSREYAYLPYSTYSYLAPPLSVPSAQRSQMEKLIRQRELGQMPSLFFGYDPQGPLTDGALAYKQEFAFQNFQFLHQNIQIYPLSRRICPATKGPMVVGCFQRGNQVNIFAPTGPIRVPDQNLTFPSCPDKGRALRADRRKNEPLIGDLQEKNIISNLHNIDNSFFQLLEDINSKGSEGQQFDMNFLDDLFPFLSSYGSSFHSSAEFLQGGLSPLSRLTFVHRTLYEKQGSVWNLGSHIVKPFGHLELRGQKRRNKIVDSLSRTYGKKIYFLFLQILRSRKICKAEQWYPFLSTLSLNSRLFSHRVSLPYDSSYLSGIPLSSGYRIRRQRDLRQMGEQLSQSFIQLSQSEKQMSQLITNLINK